MIRFEDVTIAYDGAPSPALRGVTLQVGEGEFCLVVGPTGSGKSTLLRAAAGLVPHTTGGTLSGRVLVGGRDTRTHRPRDLADVVGVVGQDVASGFVASSVEEELAWTMEQLGLSRTVMRSRVEEVLDLLGLEALRDRPLDTLSGGEQQRVAIGAVLTAHPSVLVLDEPTSALDPAAAEEVLAALTRLVHDVGLTVLLAEHRLERVVQFADHVVALDLGGRATSGDPATVLGTSAVAPPIVELGRAAGWAPLPLSVREARRRAGDLRARLAAVSPASPPREAGSLAAVPAPAALLTARGIHVRHGAPRRRERAGRRTGAGRLEGGVHAVRGVDLTLRAGEVVALMGRNGAGKSSLLWALQGSGPRAAGLVSVDMGPAGRTRGRGGADGDPARLSPSEARRLVALVPQEPRHLLYAESVAGECVLADAQAGEPPGATAAVLSGLGFDLAPQAHPRDLSEGQRLALALAVQLVARARVLLLDEPTRGLDYATKRRLTAILARHAAGGGAVLLSTHDVEFVAEVADRVLVLAQGRVVAEGPTAQVLTASPALAPQVARILHPLPLLTVPAVLTALGVGA